MHQAIILTSIFDKSARRTLEWKLHWLFRLALFGEFVGHGAFGVLTKHAWLPYFGIFGIPDRWAWELMPVVGSVDITLGTLALLAPMRAGLLYMGCWGLFTASLRPLTGEGWWEFLERSYNFGVPLLMLWVHSIGIRRPSWFTVITEVPQVTVARAQGAQLVLRGIMASMLIGHGGFGLFMAKQNLLRLYEAAGLGGVGVPLPTASAIIGGFEMLLGALCLEVQISAFCMFVCVWKLTSEFLYVPAQAHGAWWEVLERGSSYAAPLLWIGFHQVLSASEGVNKGREGEQHDKRGTCHTHAPCVGHPSSECHAMPHGGDRPLPVSHKHHVHRSVLCKRRPAHPGLSLQTCWRPSLAGRHL
jgi:hypothetical protein